MLIVCSEELPEPLLNSNSRFISTVNLKTLGSDGATGGFAQKCEKLYKERYARSSASVM